MGLRAGEVQLQVRLGRALMRLNTGRPDYRWIGYARRRRIDCRSARRAK